MGTSPRRIENLVNGNPRPFWQRLFRTQEIIGIVRRMQVVVRNLYRPTPTRDMGTVDYQFFDRARRGIGRNLEIAGLLLKPLCSKLTSWLIGKPPTVQIEHAYTDKVINEWWGRWYPKIVAATEESMNIGDSYVIASIDAENLDVVLTVVPAHTVSPIVDESDYSRIIGWTVTQTYKHPTESNKSQTISDSYTSQKRVRIVSQDGVIKKTDVYPNLIGIPPVLHIPNNRGSDEEFGRPEGEALLLSPNSLLHRYNEILDTGITGNIRAGRPILAIEEMGSKAEVDAFWSRYGRIETQTMPDGTTEETEVLDIDADQVITLAGNAKANFKSPASSSGDASKYLEILFYLYVQHTEIPEFVLGTAIPGSKASAEEQMPPFVKFIEKRQSQSEFWLQHLFLIIRLMYSLFDTKINTTAKARIVWEALTGEDGELTLKTIEWAFANGLMDEETAVVLMPLEIENPRAMLKKAKEEQAARDAIAMKNEQDFLDAQRNANTQEDNAEDAPPDGENPQEDDNADENAA